MRTKPHFNATLVASVFIVAAIILTAATVLAQMASGSSISGTVTATRGPNPAVLPPIAGATVVAQPGDYKAVTDAKGAYSVSLPPGSYKLAFSAPGFESETQSVTVASSTARISANAALFPTPAGKPVAAIKAGGRAPVQGPVSYGSSVSLDISGSQNLSPSGIRWEVRDAAGGIVNDLYSAVPRPLQLERSAVPGSSVYTYEFIPPKPGVFSVTVFLKNSFSGEEESSASYSVTAVNSPPEAVPHLIAGPNRPSKTPDGRFKDGSGLSIVAAGDRVYLAGFGIDSNANSPELYNPGGDTPDTYGKNHDWNQSQFGWTWKLEHEDASGAVVDVTAQLRAAAGEIPTDVQFPWFMAEKPGKYIATLTVSDRDPYQTPATGAGKITVTVLPESKAYAKETTCKACHKTQMAFTGMDCQSCHGPGQAHVTAKTAAKKTTISKSYEGAQCGQCHTEYFEWEKSRHSDGYAFGYSEIAAPLMLNCAKCHYPEGYADATQIAADKGITFGEVAFKKAMVPGGPLMFDFSKAPNKVGQAVSCTTCHGPHDVTANNPVGLRADKSVLCGTCHQEKWQNVLLEGIAGELGSAYEYSGTDYAVSNPHNTDDKCVLCHMNRETSLPDAVGVAGLGGHTMRMRDAGPDGKLGGFGPSADDRSRMREANSADDVLNLAPCNKCHPDAASFDIDGKQQEIYALWTRLGDMLREQNSGVLPGYKPGDKCATCHRGGTLPFDDDPTLVLENAYTNYKLVANDRSWGIHNYQYTKLLLEDSIRSLTNYLAGK